MPRTDFQGSVNMGRFDSAVQYMKQLGDPSVPNAPLPAPNAPLPAPNAALLAPNAALPAPNAALPAPNAALPAPQSPKNDTPDIPRPPGCQRLSDSQVAVVNAAQDTLSICLGSLPSLADFRRQAAQSADLSEPTTSGPDVNDTAALSPTSKPQ
ncbi:uncharacterized protein EHS24_005470 [Apiotrichum porosum]|uniref:Uncharacterized protein n=1 Tax=Apiotrichum porosum TaxID=105984 RepID=A0A427XCL1_9TREE|nr:uncharacterized protein EHS24_005470 [Apiotrichum porosum]RSH76585.1 hypothetical protein EHS24_005470 [Apiotrichum porosum]